MHWFLEKIMVKDTWKISESNFNPSTSFYLYAAADQTKAMADQMSGAAMAMPPDPKAAFKAEWEALEVVHHQWALCNAEAEILGISSHSKTE
jgi:hypothetical protein